MSSDVLLTEDTRSTGILLKVIEEIFPFKRNEHQRMISYYKDRELEKLPEVIELLEDQKEVSLISQAGMPLISDPGYLLVRTVIQKELPFTVIPGPSSPITALVHSGLSFREFMFIGFLPKKEGQLKTTFEKMKSIRQISKDTAFIAFESPNRIKETLLVMSQVMPEAQVAVSRELTKKFEETLRGTPQELLKHEYKGEITIVF
jgi:16S rRNA (cytidine1402-2'-O)-methyltransferase